MSELSPDWRTVGGASMFAGAEDEQLHPKLNVLQEVA